MKAIVLYKPGGAENLLLEKRQTPKPENGQVLVSVKAFGLNRSELMTRKGLSPSVTFPRVLGIECVGEIVEDPSGEFARGQQVAACMGGMGRDFDGSYQEFVVLPKNILMPFESSLPWETLGALPEMFQTVFGSLELALKLQKSETLLIRGGTSSIGLMAAQLAKVKGARVISTSRNAESKEKILANGAEMMLVDNGNLEEKVRSILPEGVDKALELVGTNTLADTLKSVKPGGMACFAGMLSENWSFPDFAPMDYIPSTVGLTTYDSGSIRISASNFQYFLRQIERGEIRPEIAKIFRLEEIEEAHKLMESNLAQGKIVVKI
ncbi:MAG: zinc-binding alcohol dehydrogenase family protein [Algoriphagus sp.]|uniref:zinc-binding alcohol dehydrogenase family protein n=1 Tax=Algoriphagus sp. TaxID=1872435 RepID=UPI002715DF28|nr:zinc-binding alcohol dehydrogenase family protein [Algoriphagus sp.]MDO8965275.1 zinc-binding alcohol dehydrogenase family protein [Algoriphagus sp.]MDP2042468.1 zinc-binding alcohol dehydrogenase family protein [Algoriphagus sp.]MDP3198707.1 zinc-binding alcohol dehydrogenase family protein [Algoriphagus sp.]MDP3473514.1 zinc-binding alcohol dehydrogenase family protein [Algoriphagus sp.]